MTLNYLTKQPQREDLKGSGKFQILLVCSRVSVIYNECQCQFWLVIHHWGNIKYTVTLNHFVTPGDAGGGSSCLKKNLEVKSYKRFMYLSCAWSCLWDKAVTCFTVPQGKDWLLWGKIALKSITKCLNVQLHIQLLAYSWWHKSSLIWKTECKAAHQYGKGHCALLMDHVPSIISNMNEESNWYYT